MNPVLSRLVKVTDDFITEMTAYLLMPSLGYKRDPEMNPLRGSSYQELIYACAKAKDEFLIHGRPTVVCLCGSTRFMDAFHKANLSETMAGKIVLTVGCITSADGGSRLNPKDKIRLDELHKRKIDLADEILVLNVGGYIGESTLSEIAYAVDHYKKIRYLEPLAPSEHHFEPDEDQQGHQEVLSPPPTYLSTLNAIRDIGASRCESVAKAIGRKPPAHNPSAAFTMDEFLAVGPLLSKLLETTGDQIYLSYVKHAYAEGWNSQLTL